MNDPGHQPLTSRSTPPRWIAKAIDFLLGKHSSVTLQGESAEFSAALRRADAEYEENLQYIRTCRARIEQAKDRMNAR